MNRFKLDNVDNELLLRKMQSGSSRNETKKCVAICNRIVSPVIRSGVLWSFFQREQRLSSLTRVMQALLN